MKKQSSDYIEMLFENRNKLYGAYELRTRYESRLLGSFALALLVSGFFFLIPYVLTKILTRQKPAEVMVPADPFVLDQKFVIERPEVLLGTAQPKLKNVVSADATYRIVKKEVINTPVEIKPAEPVASTGGDGNLVLPGNNLSTAGSSIPSKDSVFSEPFSSAALDVAPEFPGGQDALMKFLGDNLRYTSIAREMNISGRVYASFIINEHGKTEGVKIMRGLGHGMDEEVVRVIGLMPDWKPGKYHNRNVKTIFMLPVFFALK